MAVHGITFLGYQHYLREKLKCPEVTATSLFNSGLYRKENYLDYYDFSKRRPSFWRTATEVCGRNKVSDCVTIRSHEEYCHLKRNHATKIDMFRAPATESAELFSWYKGRYIFDAEPWMQQDRYPIRSAFKNQ